jgi:2-phosphoglycerate kinase
VSLPREKLAHVRWLGGAACAGKSTAARTLAAAHGLTLYSCDDRFEEHRRRASSERHPGFHRLMDLPPEELWTRPVAVQVQDLLRFYEDEFAMVVEDLRSLPGPVIAEGVGLLPALVAEVLAEPWRACWLIATPDFRRRHYPRRDWLDELLGRCPDPRQAFADWMARDDEIADYLKTEAASLGLVVHTVDGGTEGETVTALERLFRLGRFSP